jgi:hypothetical protein
MNVWQRIKKTLGWGNTLTPIYYDDQGNVLGPNLERISSNPDRTPKPSYYELETDSFGLSPWVYIIVDRIAEAAPIVTGKQ